MIDDAINRYRTKKALDRALNDYQHDTSAVTKL